MRTFIVDMLIRIDACGLYLPRSDLDPELVLNLMYHVLELPQPFQQEPHIFSSGTKWHSIRKTLLFLYLSTVLHSLLSQLLAIRLTIKTGYFLTEFRVKRDIESYYAEQRQEETSWRLTLQIDPLLEYSRRTSAQRHGQKL